MTGVKIKDIEGALIGKSNTNSKESGDHRAFWFNEAIRIQGEVQIGLNRKKLAETLFKNYQKLRYGYITEKFILCIQGSYKQRFYNEADAIIAAQKDLLEVVK